MVARIRMDAKKIAVFVVLIVVIVGAIVFSAKRAGVVRGRAATKAIDPDLAVELIDKKTLELMTKTAAEWQKLGGGPNGFKNPNTGTNTMVQVMVCAECGQKVPALSRFSHGSYDPAMAKCPRCGKNPFGSVRPLGP